jgi:hypothetical protein
MAKNRFYFLNHIARLIHFYLYRVRLTLTGNNHESKKLQANTFTAVFSCSRWLPN